MTINSRVIIYAVFVVIISALTLNGCTYNKEEELYALKCDTMVVTYNDHIKQILQNDCYSCHNNQNYMNDGGRKNLEGYENAKSSYLRILSRVIDERNPMPPTPSQRLSSCKIDQIEAWINQGLKEK